jgi:poly-gamma-glutamate synthase PgsB/CapB
MELTAVITALLIIIFVYEKYTHETRIAKVPVRIHVNGSRGKSSVTRLITAGLRGGGMRVVGKTTGTSPRVIYTDGSEALFPRKNKPDIIEQVDFFKIAVREKAEAVVLECMAVRPDLQRVCEKDIVKATAVVISNVREDHLDVMGPRLSDAAESLCGTLPRRGLTCYTAERDPEMLAVIHNRAQISGVHVVETRPSAIVDEQMKGFEYFEHKENVALALSVTRSFGINDEQALESMHTALPDPGALRVFKLRRRGGEIEFINALAANDPNSILSIWNRMYRRFVPGQTRIILLNTRRDRLERSQQLADLIANHISCDYLFLVGDDQVVIQNYFNRIAKKHDCRVITCGKRPVRWVYRRLIQAAGRHASIYAIGNVGGVGQPFADFFNRASARRRG